MACAAALLLPGLAVCVFLPKVPWEGKTVVLAHTALDGSRLGELLGQRGDGAAVPAARGFDVEIVGDRHGRAAARAVHRAIIYDRNGGGEGGGG